MLLRLSLLTALVVLLALPAAASASSTQSMTFEAPRELLAPATRDRTMQEIRDFGVDRVRVLVYWQDFAPAPKSKARPAFDATDPGAYPAGAWDRLDSSVQRRRRARHRRPAHAHRAGAAVGDGEQARQRHAAKPEGVPGLRDRGRPPLRRPRRPVVDLERAQPPAVPAPAVRQQEGEVAGHLPPALPRRPARPARVRQRRRHAAVRRDRPARHAARRLAAGVPARRAVPQQVLQAPGQVRPHQRRRLRASRLHDPRRPALPPAGQGRRDDRRALAPHQRAQQGGQGGRDHARPRHLPDRVRHPEHARPVRRRVAREAGRVPRRSPSTWPSSTRA